jgi:hypothetical protein
MKFADVTGMVSTNRITLVPERRIVRRRDLDSFRSFPRSRALAANQSRWLPLEDLDIATCLQNSKGDLGIVMTVH